MANGVFTPYSTVIPFVGPVTAPAWVPKDEAERILSYKIYEEIYWNHPETFRLTLRGDNDEPIYVPAGRIIVDTINRYTAPNLDFQYLGESETDTTALRAAFDVLFARERFRSKFAAAKKKGIRLGDWVLHIRADAAKPQNSRLRISVVDPASYYPVLDPEDPERIVKVHLAEEYVDTDGKVRIKRQTYEYNETGTGVISSCGIYEQDKWTNPDAAPVRDILPPTLLPPQITKFPVYHFRNIADAEDLYGSSEMRGLEVIMRGINQALTDEDVTLALEGLGVYKSGGGGPVDENGDDTDWVIGPGRVVEDPTFERVSGVNTVGPYGEHIDRLYDFMLQSSGTPDATVGKVDVQIAESGISLALQMAPILARASEKNMEIKDVLVQFLFDLQTMWFPAYEGINVDPMAALVVPVFGDPLPINLTQEIQNAVTMVEGKIMSATTARERLTEKGVVFAPDEVTRIASEAALEAETSAAALDPYAARTAAEANGAEGDAGGV